MPTLTSAIDATQKQIAVSNPAQSLARGALVRIDDEVMAFDRYGGDNRPGHRDFSTWFVYRGRNNSVAAAHSQGATVQAAVDAFLAGTFGDPPGPFDAGAGGASDAASVSYDNAESGLTAEDVQAALDELEAAPGGGLSNGWAIDTEDGGFLYNEDGPGIVVGDLQESDPFTKIEAGKVLIELLSPGTGLSVEIDSLPFLIVSSDNGVFLGDTVGDPLFQALTGGLGFYGATPATQPAAVADATDNPSAITQLNDLLAKLRTLGLIDT